ncbi:MAG TPA: thioesterase family protein [Bryobacteraceae bacterium]|nr:thioesterase family protein [Bryobacteraceae bacterium]
MSSQTRDGAHETRFRVRYAETDQMGVVYYANYLIWMELGRAEYCRAAGIRYRDMEIADGVLLAVVEAHCRYLYPARYDEEVVVKTRVAKANPRMVEFAYEIYAAESGRQLAEGSTKHMFLGAGRMRPVKLPEKYFAMFGITSGPASGQTQT